MDDNDIVDLEEPSGVAASPYWVVLPNLARPNRSSRGTTTNKTCDNGSQDVEEVEQSGFSPFVAFCFTINYILGTGFLTIPWAFVQSGLVLSVIVLIISTVISDMAKGYLLESMARAEAMLDSNMHWRKVKEPSSKEEEHQILLTPLQYCQDIRKQGRKKSDDEEEQEEEKGRRTPDHCLMKRKDKHRRQQSFPTDLTKSSKSDNYDSHDETKSLLIKSPSSFGKPQATYHSTSNTTAAAAAATTSKTVASSSQNKSVSTTSKFWRHQPFRKLVIFHKAHSFYPQKNWFVVKNRKFEVNTLCRVFLGKQGVALYTVFVGLYIVGCLWAYTTVFASAMSKAMPLKDLDKVLSSLLRSTATASATDNTMGGVMDVDLDYWNYTAYAILFGCIVVPLSCLELTEQVTLQVFMTACRFLMLFLMLGTSASGICSSNSDDNILDEDDDDWRAPLIRWQGLHKTLPILVVANMYHHSIPGLSHPVNDKRQLSNIFRFTGITTAVAYGVIGVVLGLSFGWRIEQSANLNWETCLHRHAGLMAMPSVHEHPEDFHTTTVATSTTYQYFIRLVSLYIILFPALDVISAFPLNAITLGNNMLTAYYASHVQHIDRRAKISFRLLASVPPIIGGMFVRELGKITDYTGTTGFVIGFTIPALLYSHSHRLADVKHFACTTTFYTSYASHETIAQAVKWFGITMVGLVLGSLLLSS